MFNNHLKIANNHIASTNEHVLPHAVSTQCHDSDISGARRFVCVLWRQLDFVKCKKNEGGRVRRKHGASFLHVLTLLGCFGLTGSRMFPWVKILFMIGFVVAGSNGRMWSFWLCRIVARLWEAKLGDLRFNFCPTLFNPLAQRFASKIVSKLCNKNLQVFAFFWGFFLPKVWGAPAVYRIVKTGLSIVGAVQEAR